MKHAYILLCHEWTPQLPRLVERLSTEDTFFFVHINRRTDPAEHRRMTDGLRGYDRLAFVERQVVYWGGIGMVLASLAGLRAAAASDVDFDFVSFITGQDYPIKSNAAIASFLTGKPKTSFVSHLPIPSPEIWPDQGHGLDRIRYWHFRKPGRNRVHVEDHIAFPRPGSFGRPPVSWLWDGLMRLIPLRRAFLPGWTPFGGDCYWTISGEAATCVLDLVRDRPEVLRYFKRVHIPDELFYQTVLMNSRLRDRVENEDLRYVDWTPRPSGGPPAYLDASDLDRLRASSKLFARKFDLNRHPDILDLIDRELLN